MKTMVRAAVLGVFLLLMAGCSQSGDSSPEPEANSASPQDSSGSGASAGCVEGLAISATDTTFDKECLAAPADEAFEVTFNNKDAFGHSFSVYEKEGGEEITRGEIFSGPKELANKIPALNAGTYHFQCDVHPFVMQGAIQVG